LIIDFINLQKAMQQSSLDQTIEQDSDRYDEKTSISLLPERDENDKIVSMVVQRIRHTLSTLLQSTTHKRASPIGYALSNELESFKRLV
jgi:hypothetical protein